MEGHNPAAAARGAPFPDMLHNVDTSASDTPARRTGLGLGVASWIAGVSLLALLPLLVFSAYSVQRAISECSNVTLLYFDNTVDN